MIAIMSSVNTPIHIMIVEDNDFVRMQTSRYLQKAQWKGEWGDVLVTEQNNAKAALDFINQYSDANHSDSIPPVDIMIVDVRMEPMDGFEFVRQIILRKVDSDVIFMTGDQNPDLLERMSKLKASAILMKPVEKDRLIQTVERLLVMRQRRQILLTKKDG